jgi:hypothetical protein
MMEGVEEAPWHPAAIFVFVDHHAHLEKIIFDQIMLLQRFYYYKYYY